jgi:hypothetical protein
MTRLVGNARIGLCLGDNHGSALPADFRAQHLAEQFPAYSGHIVTKVKRLRKRVPAIHGYPEDLRPKAKKPFTFFVTLSM